MITIDFKAVTGAGIRQRVIQPALIMPPRFNAIVAKIGL